MPVKKTAYILYEGDGEFDEYREVVRGVTLSPTIADKWGEGAFGERFYEEFTLQEEL